MDKVHLILDPAYIKQEDRDELRTIFSSGSFDLTVSEGETSTKGGISWFPTELIVLVTLTANGFFSAFGEDIYKKLKNKLQDLLVRGINERPGLNGAYFAFDVKGIRLYFTFDGFTCGFHHEIDKAMDMLRDEYGNITQEVERLLAFKPEMLVGSFKSVTFIFDNEENKWIIAHFNKHLN